MLLTFGLTVFAWIFFRANNLSHAFSVISEIFSSSLFSTPQILPLDLIIIVMIFVIIEWISRERQHALNFVIVEDKRWINLIRKSGIAIIVWAIILWGAFDNKEFIYFQF